MKMRKTSLKKRLEMYQKLKEFNEGKGFQSGIPYDRLPDWVTKQMPIPFDNECCTGLSECGGNTSPQAGNPDPFPLPGSAGVRTPASLVPARVEPEDKPFDTHQEWLDATMDVDGEEWQRLYDLGWRDRH